MPTRTIPFDAPLDLRRTLRPLHGHFSDDGWWLTARTPQGPATIQIRRDRDGVHGEAWGDGDEWLLEGLGSLAGLDDRPEEFQTSHPVLGPLAKQNPGLRFGRTGLVFDALVEMVCGQKVTWSEANAASRALRSKFSEPAPGPRSNLRLPPDPLRLAAAPYWQYHEAHLEKRRADVLRNAAAHAAQIEALGGVHPDQAAGRLGILPGVGPWTVAKTLEVSHGDADQVAVGDFHYKDIVVHHLTGKDRGTDDEMLELLEPFRPHRGRVIRLLGRLGPAPAFGPRMAPRDITEM